jgi:sugar/nucleoside kinase (ribokinase family)
LQTGGYVSGVSVLCLGESLVDLFCERPVAGFEEADAFVPHSGGAPANAAVVATRCGATASLGSGVGDDPWGAWLAARLSAERVGLEWFSCVPGLRTPLAFVVVNEAAEPDFLIYGDDIEAGLLSLEDRLATAIAAHDAVLIGSNTLLGERERSLTRHARELALAAGKHVLFDPNVRVRRWGDVDEAVRTVRELLDGATLLKVNRAEAELLTGEPDPAAAAEQLVAMGAALVAVTLGSDGALLRGAASASAPGVAVAARDTTGAGDVVTGVLVAALDTSGYSPAAAASALPAAVEVAARATEGWGAIDALPAAISLA